MPKDLKRCSEREELFCQLVVYQNMSGSKAMLEAGWSPGTVRSNGPGKVLARPHVAARIKELKELSLAKHGTNLETIFMSLDKHVGDAIDVQATLMHEAESESVRQRAAANIIETGKGLIIAAMPKRVTFTVRMSEIAAEGQQRLADGKTIDITPEETDEDS